VIFLRSVAVHLSARGRGLGRALVERALADARSSGAHDAWLLTESTGPFVADLGWSRADRADAPPAVAGSVEFTSACPTTAIAMRRAP
jgi:amino-acid N-acetyltransferase